MTVHLNIDITEELFARIDELAVFTRIRTKIQGIPMWALRTA